MTTPTPTPLRCQCRRRLPLDRALRRSSPICAATTTTALRLRQCHWRWQCQWQQRQLTKAVPFVLRLDERRGGAVAVPPAVATRFFSPIRLTYPWQPFLLLVLVDAIDLVLDLRILFTFEKMLLDNIDAPNHKFARSRILTKSAHTDVINQNDTPSVLIKQINPECDCRGRKTIARITNAR